MILLLGGTTDSREAATVLLEHGYDVLLSVVSNHAADIARHAVEPFSPVHSPDRRRGSLRVRVGELDEAGFKAVLEGIEAVVDATHPFAEQISTLAQAVCGRHGVPYIRLDRPPVELPEGLVTAPSATRAAQLAVRGGGDGAILVTVGTRTLDTYVDAARATGRRLVARVMPTTESIAHCLELGMAPGDIVAMQGPAGADLDAALLKHLGVTVMVTKESGEIGGLTAKLEACRRAGVTPIVVMRPHGAPQSGSDQIEPETVTDIRDLPSRLVRMADEISRPAPSVFSAQEVDDLSPGFSPRSFRRGLLQVYTGDGKGKTTAAVGLALRAHGRGLAVAMIQFVKGGAESGELAEMHRAGIHVVRTASRRTGLIRGEAHAEDKQAVGRAWQTAGELLRSGDWDMVILDELHTALRSGLLDLEPVLKEITGRPAGVEVVTTGRDAPAELRAEADLVTEMVARKHPYPGIAARRGIEY
ncbi:MAG: precorrin-6A reductase [Thermoleophilia bacterium]|nr:precorrin-6A reductase [Thermoleophilia bacterium]